MWKHKLGMSVSLSYGESIEKQIEIMSNVGFESFFTHDDSPENMKKWADKAAETGLIYQSVHAPFTGCADLWHDDAEKADKAFNEITDCIHKCYDIGVDIMVSHVFIGFENIGHPTAAGVERYGKIIDEAEKNGINIAFENTEGDEFLDKIMTEFHDRKNVGFCLDTGHEMCYNRSVDLLDLYGDKLIATHINDNLGIRDYGGKITYIDDLHLLPFDGIGDWDYTAQRFIKHKYNGILTFELNKTSKPGRHENDKYEKMTTEEYITEAYIRACRFASKLDKRG